MVLSARKNGNRWQRQLEDCDNAGLAAIDNEAVVAEAPLGKRDGVAQRWATTWCGGWCVSCFPSCYLSHIARIARDLCVLSVGPMIKSGACSCSITDQRLGCHRAVLFSRQCSQTSAGVWHRAQPPQRPEVHDGRALASEAGVICVAFLLYVLILVALLQVKNQHRDGAEQAAAPGVVHIDVAAAWRSE